MESTDQILQDFQQKGCYIADLEIATAVLLAYRLGKPLLIEGEPGVGKTELAKVIAKLLNCDLIRLQCYEGIDETKILYEWAYAKQLLYVEVLKGNIAQFLSGTRSLKDAVKKIHQHQDIFFGKEFLQVRPLLKALTSETPVVLLIDEVDRSDRETEAFLLEALSDFQVSIPEIGTITAKNKPFVILTSNNSRELSDALKRRCLYLYIDHPSREHEFEILQLKVPGLTEALNNQIVDFVQTFRKQNWKKAPNISESIDWALALVSLNVESLDVDIVSRTINLLLKHKSDLMKSLGYIQQQFISPKRVPNVNQEVYDSPFEY